MTRLAFFALAVLVPTLAAAEGRAYIGDVQGVATLERDGAKQPASINTPIFTGDRIRTGDGRVDVVFPDNATLVIDRYSEVEFLTPFRVRVLAGTIEHQQADSRVASSYSAPYGYVWYPVPARRYSPAAHRHGNQRDPYRPPREVRARDDYQPRSAWPTPLVSPWPMLPLTTPPTTVATPLAPPPAAANPPAGRHLVSAPVGGGISRH